MRSILDAAVSSADRPRLGTLLATIGEQTGADLDISREQVDRGPLDLA